MRNIKRLFILILLSFPNIILAVTNVADQRFLDNADQFSDEFGVRIYNDSSQTTTQEVLDPNSFTSEQALQLDLKKTATKFDDPNLTAVSKQNKKEIKVKKKSFGLSFSDMAKTTQKKKRGSSSSKEKSAKSFGFTFTQMAKMAQTPSTPNMILSR